MTTSIRDSQLPAFMNARTAAQFLVVQPRTLDRWRWSGDGPRFRKHGGVVVYAVADLLEWSEAQSRRSTSDPGTVTR